MGQKVELDKDARRIFAPKGGDSIRIALEVVDKRNDKEKKAKNIHDRGL
jgi:hypothetical protein